MKTKWSYKRVFRILLWAVGIFFLLQAVIFGLLQIPAVQTWTTAKIASVAASGINGEIAIGKFHYRIFNKVTMERVSVISTEQSPHLDSLKRYFNQSDTLFSVQRLSATLSIWDLIDNNLILKNLELDGGVFNLQEELKEGGNNLSRILNLTKGPAPKRNTKPGKMVISLEKFRMGNFRFTLNNPFKMRDPQDTVTRAIDFADMSIGDINLEAENIEIKNGGEISAKVKSLTAGDKSGYGIRELSGDFTLGGGKAMLRNGVIADPYSKITTDCIYLGYKTPRSFAYFCDSIHIHMEASNSYFNFGTLGCIKDEFIGNNIGLFFNGTVDGSISDIHSDKLDVTMEDGLTNLSIAFSLKGLPNAAKAILKGNILKGSTNSSDVARVISQFGHTEEPESIRNFAQDKLFNLNGNLYGRFDSLQIKTAITAAECNIQSNVLYQNLPQAIKITGEADILRLEAGKLLERRDIGNLCVRFEGIEVLTGRGRKSSVEVNNFNISQFGFKGRNFSGISGSAKYSAESVKASVISADPLLKFSAEALYGMGGVKEIEIPNFSLYHADLFALELNRRDSISQIRLNAYAHLSIDGNGYINGDAGITNINYTNSNETVKVGDLRLNTKQDSTRCLLTSESNFAEVKFSGEGTLQQFVSDFLTSTPDKDIQYSLSELSQGDRRANHIRRNYKASIKSLKTTGLMTMIAPDLYIQPGTVAEVDYSGTDYQIDVKSGKIIWKRNLIRDLDLHITSTDSTNTAQLRSGHLNIAGLSFSGSEIDADAKHNLTKMRLRLRKDSTDRAVAELNLRTRVDNNWQLFTQVENSFFNFAGNRWEISPSEIALTDSTKSFRNICISNTGQMISLNGTLSRRKRDSLNVEMKEIDLSILDSISHSDLSIGGKLSGMATITNWNGSPKILADIEGIGITAKDAPIGDLHISSRWNDSLKRAEVFAENICSGKRTLSAEGYLHPSDSSIDVIATLDEFPIDFTEAFLKDIISDFSGTISGAYHLTGTTSDPLLTAAGCKFNKFGFKVDFTGVKYFLNGPFSVNEERVDFTNIALTDSYGHKGWVGGGIKHTHFRNIKLDLHMHMQNIQTLNTFGDNNPVFYGKAFTTGDVGITGPLNNITISPDITTNLGTDIHIPLIMGQSSAKATDLLTFKVPEIQLSEDMEEEYLRAMRERLEKRSGEGLTIDFKGNITPEATLLLEIDKAAGDILKVNGSGNIAIKVVPSKDIFTINGDYTVNQGSYRFVLANMLTRDFTIQEGGRITFNGDIARSRLDLTALYNVKTSINALINDTVSVGTRRNVWCKLGITGTLTSPKLKFDIEIPDLDPTTELMVQSALKTEEAIQRQFAALLVYGGFAQVNNNATDNINLYSNVSGILSGQLNYLMQHLGIPLGLGVDYNQDNKGKGIYDVSLSTQLFDNRVVINGNIGNNAYSQSGSSIIGNIDVEIKLDEKGKVRLNLFSHAPDKYSNYLDNSQRSGAGIVFQKEFNSFRELFRKKSKEEKEFIKALKERRRRERKEMKSLR